MKVSCIVWNMGKAGSQEISPGSVCAMEGQKTGRGRQELSLKEDACLRGVGQGCSLFSY